MVPHLPRPARRFRPEFSLAMVNVVLLLLLYFLVAGDPAEQTERAIMPPSTRDLPLEGLPRPLLSLLPEGALVLDGVPVTRAALLARVAAGDLPRLHILTSRSHPARALLALTGDLAAAGAEAKLITLRNRADAGGP
jgi:biopolymer transport protein ExbD